MELIKSFSFKCPTMLMLTFFLAFSLSYSGDIGAITYKHQTAQKTDKAIAKTGTQTTEEADTPELKKILLELIKQNEHMDDIIDEMEESEHSLSLIQISSLDLTANIISTNLERLSLLTKNELIKIQPSDNTFTYAKTILSYADKLDKKIYRAQNLVKNFLSKKSILRDTPNSKKTKKIKGKSLLRIIKEQKAIHKLAKNIKQLKISSKKLCATSKWLFIVSKV